MLFCLNNVVYSVTSLSQVAKALGLEDEDYTIVLSVIYVTTSKALTENTETLLTLGIHTGELEREQGDIITETQGFRAFLTAVEAQYPTVLLKSYQVMKDAKDGKLLLDGGSIVVITEK